MIESTPEQKDFFIHLIRILNEWLNTKYSISSTIHSNEISSYTISLLYDRIPNIDNSFDTLKLEIIYIIYPYAKDIYISSIESNEFKFTFDIEVIPITTETYIDINSLLDIDNMYCESSYGDKINKISKYLGLTVGGNMENRLYYYLSMNSDENTVKLLEKAKNIRNKLNLIKGIWKCLPNSLFLIAFIKKSKCINPELSQELKRRYNNQDDYYI